MWLKESHWAWHSWYHDHCCHGETKQGRQQRCDRLQHATHRRSPRWLLKLHLEPAIPIVDQPPKNLDPSMHKHSLCHYVYTQSFQSFHCICASKSGAAWMNHDEPFSPNPAPRIASTSSRMSTESCRKSIKVVDTWSDPWPSFSISLDWKSWEFNAKTKVQILHCSMTCAISGQNEKHIAGTA